MNPNKLVYSIVILGSLTLMSCAKTNQITELSSEIKNINDKVNEVTDRVDLLNSEIEQSKNEAMRANKRLDNQISFFHK